MEVPSTKCRSHLHLQLGSSSTNKECGTHRVHPSPAAGLGVLRAKRRKKKSNTLRKRKVFPTLPWELTGNFPSPKHRGLDEALASPEFIFSRELPVLSKLYSHRKSRAGKWRLSPAHLGTRWEGSSGTIPLCFPGPRTPLERKSSSSASCSAPTAATASKSSAPGAASEANKHWANQQETPLHQSLALGREGLKSSTCESREGGWEDTLGLGNNKTK